MCEVEPVSRAPCSESDAPAEGQKGVCRRMWLYISCRQTFFFLITEQRLQSTVKSHFSGLLTFSVVLSSSTCFLHAHVKGASHKQQEYLVNGTVRGVAALIKLSENLQVSRCQTVRSRLLHKHTYSLQL